MKLSGQTTSVTNIFLSLVDLIRFSHYFLCHLFVSLAGVLQHTLIYYLNITLGHFCCFNMMCKFYFTGVTGW